MASRSWPNRPRLGSSSLDEPRRPRQAEPRRGATCHTSRAPPGLATLRRDTPARPRHAVTRRRRPYRPGRDLARHRVTNHAGLTSTTRGNADPTDRPRRGMPQRASTLLAPPASACHDAARLTKPAKRDRDQTERALATGQDATDPTYGSRPSPATPRLDGPCLAGLASPWRDMTQRAGHTGAVTAAFIQVPLACTTGFRKQSLHDEHVNRGGSFRVVMSGRHRYH
jgi:hypothetical protein